MQPWSQQLWEAGTKERPAKELLALEATNNEIFKPCPNLILTSSNLVESLWFLPHFMFQEKNELVTNQKITPKISYETLASLPLGFGVFRVT